MAADPQTTLDAAEIALNIAPKVYDDLLHPTMEQTGILIAHIPRAINAALSGLDIWIAKREYSIEETKKLLAIKMRNIEPEKIVPPEPYVAIPAIQAISYCMDSIELREMYANLLANSMNADIKDNVHPAFVEIIKQLSPLDAQVLKKLFEYRVLPMITLCKVLDSNRGKVVLARHITIVYYDSIIKITQSLDNLSRCKLINFEESQSYNDKNHYQSIRVAPYFIDLKQQLMSNLKQPEESLKEDEGHISITDMGKLFYEICIKEQ